MDKVKQGTAIGLSLAGGLAGGAMLGNINDIKPADVIPNVQSAFEECVAQGHPLERCQEQMFVVTE